MNPRFPADKEMSDEEFDAITARVVGVACFFLPGLAIVLFHASMALMADIMSSPVSPQSILATLLLVAIGVFMRSIGIACQERISRIQKAAAKGTLCGCGFLTLTGLVLMTIFLTTFKGCC